ncbi:MAG: hypothetical protein KJZ78_08820 [Bryobacteraceae bacterium]|nr:hypothetical protein [Bryobacteraceae bacterium]HEU0138699.1 FliH/SctL family protein [Bryobacteraceae bacterium]
MKSTSKVLSGDAATALPSIAWQNIGSQQPAGYGVSAGGPVRDEDAATYQARIRELEQGAAQKIQQAYREGEAAGAQQAAARVQPLLEKLARTIAEVSGFKAQFRKEAEQDLVKLAVSIARRVLHRELTVDPEALVGIVRVALDRMDTRDCRRVRVSPADADAIRAALNRLGLTVNIEVAPDSRLERGAVVFDTSRGQLDGSIETQLQEIERGFTDLVRRS